MVAQFIEDPEETATEIQARAQETVSPTQTRGGISGQAQDRRRYPHRLPGSALRLPGSALRLLGKARRPHL